MDLNANTHGRLGIKRHKQKCQHCKNYMLVGEGQIAMYHGACRQAGRREARRK